MDYDFGKDCYHRTVPTSRFPVSMHGHGRNELFSKINPVLVGLILLIGSLTSTGCSTLQNQINTQASMVFPVRVEHWSTEGFVGKHYTTEHFELYSTLRDDAFEQSLPALLEAAYQQFQTSLPSSDDPAKQTSLTTYLFGTKAEWLRHVRRRYLTELASHHALRQNGFSQGTTSVLYFTRRSATLASLVHEAWHQYASATIDSQLPGWLNEGLACYYETVSNSSKGPIFTPGKNSMRMPVLRESLQINRLLSVEQVLSMDLDDPAVVHNTETALQFSAQAWAMVSLLRHGGNGRYSAQFDQMLQDLSMGRYSIKLSAATLTQDAHQARSSGDPTLRVYFNLSVRRLKEVYYEHLLSLTDYD